MSCDRARTSASNQITLINILFYPSGALCFHLYIFIFSNVFFYFFESITNRWTKVVVQHFWDTLYVLGRGIGLEIRSRFESRSKIESVIALHRWHGGRGEGFCSKRHVFERIPGLLRTLYLYVREDPSVCRDPRRLFVPDTEIMGGNSASLRNVASGGRRRLKGTVINRVMGVCGSAVHHGQSCFRSSFNRDPKTSYLYFLIYYSWFYIPKFI